MLRIVYGDIENAIYNTAAFFDNSYLDNWLMDELSLKIIKAIDKGEVISPQLIITKALGPIPPVKLSGGAKTLLLIRNKPELIYNASTCGDNCARWILKIAKASSKDTLINLHHMMDFGNGTFEITVENTGAVVRNMKELVLEAIRFI